MAVRIYSLAKELKIENKELVDICTKAGITGKGSALASLTDEEIERVTSFIKGSAKPARVGAPSERGSSPASAPSVAQEAPAFTRDEYVAVGAAKGRIRVLEPKSKKVAGETPRKEGDGDAPKPPAKKETLVSLAKLPEVKQPTAPAPPDEPKAQKPEIRLPKDAIRGAKEGRAAPLGHLTKLEAKAKGVVERKRPVGGRAAAGPATGPPLGKATRGVRRGKLSEMEGVDARMGNARAARAKDRKARPGRRRGDEDGGGPRRSRRLTRTGTNTAAPRKGNVVLELPCTVRSFSEAAGVSSGRVIMTLMNLGQQLTINQRIDDEYVELLAAELGVEVEFRHPESLEESVLQQIRESDDDPESLQPRPPVVTFLGHVDHGKTSLLDRIIGTNVVAGEAGGITQQIRAYQIDRGDGRPIAFVDTPGHEAFTEMRARGANVTDIAVLVVAADDGVMPQTEEAISHARAAGVPIVVALNKIDLPGVDTNRIMQQLAALNLLPSQWGGDVEVISTSATKGDGIDELLETLLLTAEIHHYRANPDRPAFGTCLEAEQEPGRGVIAKLIVKNGTLRLGDVVLCGTSYGRIKAMYDTLDLRRRVEEAGPSMPVNVTGLDTAPQAGELFYALPDIAQARQIAEQRTEHSREQSLSGSTTRVSLARFQELVEEGKLGSPDEVVTLNLIIRADTRGSIEAIQKELGKLYHPEVQIKILQASVGGITSADVMLAHASHAVIIGFNVIPDDDARALADDRQVEVRRYEIIYKLTDDIRATLEGKLKPEERVVEVGHALVKQTFHIGRSGVVAGCQVMGGSIERGCRIRVNREGRMIGEYPLDSLRREKDDVREVARGLECGIKLAGFNDVKVGDVLEAYKIEEVARTL